MKSFVTKYLVGCLLIGTVLGTAQAGDEKGPGVAIVLRAREASARPQRLCGAHTGGGNIHVTQDAPDTVVITMTGAAATGIPFCLDSLASFDFELCQSFDVVITDPKIARARLVLTGQTIGVLRSRGLCCVKGGAAQLSTPGHVSIQAATTPILALNMPARSVCAGENLSINDREGPITVPVASGTYTLRQLFGITAAQDMSFQPCKAASVDFAPGETFKEEWIGKREPFRGVSKKEFGFQVILKVVPDEQK